MPSVLAREYTYTSKRAVDIESSAVRKNPVFFLLIRFLLHIPRHQEINPHNNLSSQQSLCQAANMRTATLYTLALGVVCATAVAVPQINVHVHIDGYEPAGSFITEKDATVRLRCYLAHSGIRETNAPSP